MLLPQGAVPVYAASGNVTNATAAAALAADANRWNYLTGFDVTGAGATAASIVTVTVSGLYGGITKTYKIGVPAGATTQITPFRMTFDPPLKSAAKNTAITVSAAAFGAGNLHASTNVQGYAHSE